jgi:predicted nucleic acid-binding protein
MIGFDTGFFVELLKENQGAVAIWRKIVDGEEQSVICPITFFELKKLGLKGQIEKHAVDILLENLPLVCSVTWLDREGIFTQAAQLSHGMGIPMADALILAVFKEAECETIYTTDAHLEAYRKSGVTVMNLFRTGSST